MLSLNLRNHLIFNPKFLTADLLLVDDGRLDVASTDQLAQERLWFLVGDQQAGPDVFKVLAKASDGLQVEPGPQVTTLFDVILFDRPVVKARIEAVNWQHFFVCDLLLLCSPVHHWVIMEAQVIAQPENYPVHAFFVKSVIESF